MVPDDLLVAKVEVIGRWIVEAHGRKRSPRSRVQTSGSLLDHCWIAVT